VADGDVGFLDALRIARGDVEEEIDFVGERAARFAGKSDEISAAGAAGFDASDHVRAIAAGGKGDEDVLRREKGFNLARKDVLEAVVVASGGEDGRIRGDREGRKADAVLAQANDEFGGEMLGVGGAAAVAEENEFAVGAKSGGGALGEFSDARDEVARKAALDAGAFFELAANLFECR